MLRICLWRRHTKTQIIRKNDWPQTLTDIPSPGSKIGPGHTKNHDRTKKAIFMFIWDKSGNLNLDWEALWTKKCRTPHQSTMGGDAPGGTGANILTPCIFLKGEVGMTGGCWRTAEWARAIKSPLINFQQIEATGLAFSHVVFYFNFWNFKSTKIVNINACECRLRWPDPADRADWVLRQKRKKKPKFTVLKIARFSRFCLSVIAWQRINFMN